jgi:hypothetical protein
MELAADEMDSQCLVDVPSLLVAYSDTNEPYYRISALKNRQIYPGPKFGVGGADRSTGRRPSLCGWKGRPGWTERKESAQPRIPMGTANVLSSQYWEVQLSCCLQTAEIVMRFVVCGQPPISMYPGLMRKMLSGLREEPKGACGSSLPTGARSTADTSPASTPQAKLSARIVRLAGATTWRLRRESVSAGWNVPSLAHPKKRRRTGVRPRKTAPITGCRTDSGGSHVAGEL